MMRTDEDLIYDEKVSSKWTEILFLTLTVLFSLLFIWRVIAGHRDILAYVFFILFVLFLFYSVNYRILIIRITSEHIRLIFGIFAWTIPFQNIETCQLDTDLPTLMKYGGAGIHFMFVGKRYRVSFNFLEHPRVVIGLKRKAGLVKDVSFSTRRPEELLKRIRDTIASN